MSTYSPALLVRWNWALTRAAAPCPPLSASGQVAHTCATAYRYPVPAELVMRQSAMKRPG